MARPIKETPVLKGRDAKMFIDQMIKLDSSPASKQVRSTIKENYEKLSKIAKF